MTEPSPSPDRHPYRIVLRTAAAGALFVGGLVHLQLYFDGYRDFPNASLGRSFVLQALGSVVLAVALVLRTEWWVRVGAMAVAASTLVAFALSRSDRGVFGFTERGLQPSPQAALTLVVEIAALVLLAATFVPPLGAGTRLGVRAGAAVGLAAVAITIGGAVLWDRDNGSSRDSQAAPATTPPTTMAGAATTVPAGAPTTAPPTSNPSGTADGASTTAPNGTTAGAGTAAPPAAPTATTPPAATDAPAATGNAVQIVDFAFAPPTIEVATGSTVEWTNDDSFAHTIVAEDRTFISDELGGGDAFSFTFDAAGTYAYICGIHPSMQGEVVVTG